MNNKLFSIVIPVYNAERHLEECVESIINQDVRFLDNIELILVNDGSLDSSGYICNEYAEKYPDNIIYINQDNGGASNARNRGLESANGEYIGFVDADDYISTNALSAVKDFFKKTSENVDLAIIRVVQFGSKNRERPINRKFNKGTRVADLNYTEWFDISPRVAPSFIRAPVAKKYRFKEGIRFYEDTRYMNEIVGRTMRLGIVSKGTYYNRKFDNSENAASITTGATNEKRFYIDSPENVSLYLLEKFKGENDYPPLYFQYLVLYEMRWRLFYNPHLPQEVLTDHEYKHYQEVNKKIIALISNEAIIGFKGNNVWQRVFLLNFKHNKDVLKEANFNKKNKLVWKKYVLFNHMKKLQTRLTNVEVNEGYLVLEGYFAEFILEGIKIYPQVNGVRHENISFKADSLRTTAMPLEYPAYKRTEFITQIRLNNRIQHINFAFNIRNESHDVKILTAAPMFEQGVVPPWRSKMDGYIIFWNRDKLSIAPDTLFNRVNFELRLVKRYLLLLYTRLHRRIRSINVYR